MHNVCHPDAVAFIAERFTSRHNVTCSALWMCTGPPHELAPTCLDHIAHVPVHSQRSDLAILHHPLHLRRYTGHPPARLLAHIEYTQQPPPTLARHRQHSPAVTSWSLVTCSALSLAFSRDRNLFITMCVVFSPGTSMEGNSMAGWPASFNASNSGGSTRVKNVQMRRAQAAGFAACTASLC